MASKGTRQVVQEVEDTDGEDDAPPPSCRRDSETDARASEDLGSPPPLVSGSGDEEDVPPLMDESSGDEEPPSETSQEDNTSLPDLSSCSSGDDDEPPPLDDPGQEGVRDSGSESDTMPDLMVNGDTSDEEDGSEDGDLRGPMAGLRPGFLCDSGRSKGNPNKYSNAGVGQREEGPAAAAQRLKQQRPSAPYSGVGAGAREDLRAPPSRPQQQQQQQYYGPFRTAEEATAFLRQQQQQPPPGMAEFIRQQQAQASSSAAAGTQYGWQGQAERPRPKPKQRSEPREAQAERPAEVWQDKSGLEAFQRELEELRKARGLHRDAERNEKPAPVGRCCLNRGLNDRVQECAVDKVRALIESHQKRTTMKCSAGCLMFWHFHCWRTFQEGYEAETRGQGDKQQGINLLQALRVKDKHKLPVVRCVTPGCPGYINFLGTFEGPLGHETYKMMHYQPTQDNLAAIKEAMAEDKRAAVAEKAAAKAATAEAALQAWRIKTKWQPKGPKKPRNKPRKTPQQLQQLANGKPIMTAAAAPAAASDVTAGQQPVANGDAAAADAAAHQRGPAAEGQAAPTAAAAAAAQPAEPKVIRVKRAVKPISVIRAASAKEPAVDESGPASPSGVSVEGSASASQSASQSLSRHETTEQLQQLGRRSDHFDATYHASVEDLMSQQQQHLEVEGAGRVKSKRKKGVKLHLDEFQDVLDSHGTAEDLERQQQEKQMRLSGIRPPRRQQQPEPVPQQQQQQQVAVPSAGDFPTLNAATRHDEQQLVETDYTAEALQRLIIRADDPQCTPFILLECVDFYMIRKRGEDPKEVIFKVIRDKTGEDVIEYRLFEKQEAVALMLMDAAARACFTLCHRYQLYRKQLQPSFLRHFPWDDELHMACPQYMTLEMRAEQERQQREQQEREQRERQQQAADQARARASSMHKKAVIRPKDPELLRLEHESKQQKLSPLELLQKVHAYASASTAAAVAGATEAKFADTAAAAAGGSSDTATDRQQSMGQQQQPSALQPAARAPGSPSQQRNVVLTQPAPPQAPAAATAAMQYMQQPVAGYMPGFAAPGFPGYPAVMPTHPMMPFAGPVYQHGVQPMIPQPQYGFVPTWQQQQGFVGAAGSSDGYLWQQQEQFGEGYEGMQQEEYVEQELEADGGDGDWEGEAWPQDGADEHQGASAEGADEHVQQFGSEGAEPPHVEDRGRAAVVGSMSSGTSGSPATRLNPLAKEFRVPSASTPAAAAAAPSRLSASSIADDATAPADASSTPAASGTSTTAPQAVAEAPCPAADADSASASADSAASAAAAPELSAATSDTSSDASHDATTAALQPAPVGSSNISAPVSPRQAATVTTASGSQVQRPSSAPIAGTAESSAATAGVATASGANDVVNQLRISSAGAGSSSVDLFSSISDKTSTGVLGTSSGGMSAVLAPPLSLSSSLGSSNQLAMQDSGPPADHIFDVVVLVGCNTDVLGKIYRNPQTPLFGLSLASLPPGSEQIVVVQSAGLILFNVDNQCVQGLWVATANKDDVIHWKLVADYIDVPRSVYEPVISLSPFKARYEGVEALAIVKALWSWAHPVPVTPLAPLASLAPLDPNVLRPVSAGSTTQERKAQAPTMANGILGAVQQRAAHVPVGTRPHATQGHVVGAATPATTTTMATLPAANTGSVGSLLTTQPWTLPPQRQLPPHIALLANRPGSAKTDQAPKPVPPNRICTLCEAHPSGWLGMPCKHWGPCLECLPKPEQLNGPYQKPPGYHVCERIVDGVKCGQEIQYVIRVI